jgi:hypothetical protein
MILQINLLYVPLYREFCFAFSRWRENNRSPKKFTSYVFVTGVLLIDIIQKHSYVSNFSKQALEDCALEFSVLFLQKLKIPNIVIVQVLDLFLAIVENKKNNTIKRRVILSKLLSKFKHSFLLCESASSSEEQPQKVSKGPDFKI